MSAESGFRLTPLPACFGATVEGLRLAEISDAAFADLYRAWLEYGLLIFPGQHLTREEQVAFTQRFGELEFAIAPISNVRGDGAVRPESDNDDVIKVLKGNMGWHCDSTYMPVQSKGAVFTAHVVPPEGGETEFTDLAAAYDALDASTRDQIEGMSALHSLRFSQAKLGHVHKEGSAYSGYGMQGGKPPRRPLVKIHSETGRRCLLIGRHAYGLTGLDEAASEALLARLTEEACRPPRVWSHRWTAGDAIVWDNRRLMHRGRPWDMTLPRVMYHSRIAGDPVADFAAPD
jgi:alpha-ketoglutarate-dependent taurine dioxygenase